MKREEYTIKESANARFCFLLELFGITLDELCELCFDITEHEYFDDKEYNEIVFKEWIAQRKKYILYKLRKREHENKDISVSLKKYIELFKEILEDKKYDTQKDIENIINNARTEFLKDKEHNIIFCFDNFYDFFLNLVDNINECIPNDMNYPSFLNLK